MDLIDDEIAKKKLNNINDFDDQQSITGKPFFFYRCTCKRA
jgi:hypothetical protein